jgi:hypothetical protein
MDSSHPLVRALEEHLATHPHAADSAEGVARWWLGPLSTSTRLTDVQEALNTLVALQRLRCVRLVDGSVLYSKPSDPTQ